MSMKNKARESRNVKRSMYMSAVSIFLCLVMLVGATFAWFTDTTVNKGNRIQAGYLKMSIDAFKFDYLATAAAKKIIPYSGTDSSLKTNIAPLVNDQLFYPDKWGTRYIQIGADGINTLPFKYDLTLLFDQGSMPDATYARLVDNIMVRLVEVDTLPDALDTNELNGDDCGVRVSPYIDTYYNYDNTSYPVGGTWERLRDYVGNNATKTISGQYGEWSDEMVTGGLYGNVPTFPTTKHTYRLDYYMCYGAGNEYQGLSFGFGLAATATQLEAPGEKSIVYISSQADLDNAFLAANQTKNAGKTLVFVDNVVYEGDLEIPITCNIDLNGFALSIRDGANKGKLLLTTPNPCSIDIARGYISAAEVVITTPKAVVNLADTLIFNDDITPIAAVVGTDCKALHDQSIRNTFKLSPLWNGSNILSGNTINNFGNVTFSIDKELDLSAASGNRIVIQQQLAMDNNSPNIAPGRETNMVFVDQPFYRDTTWTGLLVGMDSDSANAGETGTRYPRHLDASPTVTGIVLDDKLLANQVVQTGETSVGKRLPEIYTAVKNSENTATSSVYTRTVVKLYIKGALVQTTVFPAIKFNDGGTTVSRISMWNDATSSIKY